MVKSLFLNSEREERIKSTKVKNRKDQTLKYETMQNEE